MKQLLGVSVFMLLIFGFAYAEDKKCTAPGYMCSNCTHLSLCVEDAEGNFDEHDLGSCADSYKCITNSCVSDPDPICDNMVNVTFPCSSVGFFPHPYVCNKFIICVSSQNKFTAFENTCPSGYAYNAKTTYCDKPLPNKVCGERDYPIPVCPEQGIIDGLRENPTIYYICEPYSTTQLTLYPFQYLCPSGEIYNGYECSGERPTTTSDDPTDTTSSDDSTTLTTTLP